MVFDIDDMKTDFGFGCKREIVTLSLMRKLQQTFEQHLPDFANGRLHKSSKRISPPMEPKLKKKSDVVSGKQFIDAYNYIITHYPCIACLINVKLNPADFFGHY